MKILMIYENVPESTNFYALELDADDEKLNTIELAHGNIINSEDMPENAWDACQRINQALSKPEHLPIAGDKNNPIYEGWGSIWLDKEISLENLPAAGPFEKVFWTGFIL